MKGIDLNALLSSNLFLSSDTWFGERRFRQQPRWASESRESRKVTVNRARISRRLRIATR